MNILENVCQDLKEKIENQNFNIEMYGNRSHEYHTARIMLNTTLETLQLCHYINSYSFQFKEIDENRLIYSLSLFLDDFKIVITSEEVEYYG